MGMFDGMFEGMIFFLILALGIVAALVCLLMGVKEKWPWKRTGKWVGGALAATVVIDFLFLTFFLL